MFSDSGPCGHRWPQTPEIKVEHTEKIQNDWFYRVQHSASATLDRHSSFSKFEFQAKGQFNSRSDFCHGGIMRHLDWNNDSEPFTSFVSVFDSYYDALVRALFFYQKGYKQITITVITTRGLNKKPIYSAEKAQTNRQDPYIRIWQNISGTDDSVWMQMRVVGPELGIPNKKIQQSEWLACGFIREERVAKVFPLIGSRIYFSLHESQSLEEHINSKGNIILPPLSPEKGDAMKEFQFKKKAWISPRAESSRAPCYRPLPVVSLDSR